MLDNHINKVIIKVCKYMEWARCLILAKFTFAQLYIYAKKYLSRVNVIFEKKTRKNKYAVEVMVHPKFYHFV